MENLYVLELNDILALIGGITFANALALLLFIVFGWSALPQGAGFLMTIASFFLVVILLTLFPAIMIFVLIFISS